MDNNYNYAPQQKSSTLAIVSLVIAIFSWCCNPCYLLTFLATFFAVFSLCSSKHGGTGFSIAALIVVAVGIVVQMIFDIMTMGVGIFF